MLHGQPGSWECRTVTCRIRNLHLISAAPQKAFRSNNPMSKATGCISRNNYALSSPQLCIIVGVWTVTCAQDHLDTLLANRQLVLGVPQYAIVALLISRPMTKINVYLSNVPKIMSATVYLRAKGKPNRGSP